MSQETHKASAKKILDYISAGKFDKTAFSADFEAWSSASGAIPGESYLQRAGGLVAAFSDGPHFTVLDITAEDNRVAMRVHGHGKVITGKDYVNDYCFVVYFDKQGNIHRIYEYMNVNAVVEVLRPAFEELAKRAQQG